MITVNDVLEFLSRKFPLDTACDFDNVGLLVGNSRNEVKKILVCLDCDFGAIKTATETGANLIVTHHPVIFGGIKSVCENSVVYELIKNDISVISMHTNLDIAKGGVTETLCRVIGGKNIENFVCSDGFLIRKCEFDSLSADALAKNIGGALGFNVRYADGGNIIKNALVCSGSGGDFIADAVNGNFDALISADIKHNQFICGVNSGVSVFDAGHFASENIIVPVLESLLREKFTNSEVIIYNLPYFKSV